MTDAVAVMNRQDLAIAEKYRLCREAPVLLPGIGLDPVGYEPASAREKAAIRRELGLPEDAFVLIFGGEFSERKNQAFLIRALRRMPEDVFLLLPGEGALWEQARQSVRDMGLEDRVRMPGFVTDMARLCRCADGAVSASRSEGLPFFVMEAMLCGLPWALSRVKGHEDLTENGEGTYPFGDETAYLRTVAELYADPELRRRRGLAGRQRVLERHTPEKVAPLYWAVLEGDGEA